MSKEKEADDFLSAVKQSLEFEEKRKPVEEAMSSLLGKEVHVTDFRHLEGNKYEFLVELEAGEEIRQVVEFPQ